MNHGSNTTPYAPGHRAARALVAITLSLLATLGHATSFDAKRYSGGDCQAAYPSHADRLSFGTGAAVTNISHQGAYVVCPIVREYLSEAWDWWGMTLKDQHPSYDISCSLSVVSKEGNLLETKTIRTSGTGVTLPGYPNRGLCHPWSGCPDRPVYKDANYAMRCYLPGRAPNGRTSSILSYKMIEER